ncbi:MAG: ATP-dependent RecD-like DNA helicase [Anaerolineales bacterium]|nr:ATP-dependent RecD-like DNA helicase [Anaerolineales bacterium]MCB8950463.1 ATP-dependent RecD-like DNA helicase [Ardenticatenales bacterium]
MNAQLDEIAGSVERVTYYNPENGYSVIRLQPDSRGMLPFKYASGRDALITVVGNLPEVNPGEWLKLQGRWSQHPKHGRQFQVELCEKAMPASLEGIKRYLGSGLVRGIGPVMAERIVNTFGEQTLDVIDYEPTRLREVLGIGKKRVSGIIKAWEEQRAIKDVMLFLQSHNVSTGLAVKIYKRYGDEALRIVQNTPYQLVQDIHGVGFKTADKLAQALGLAVDDPDRIEAGIAYTLNRLVEEGHVYVPQPELEPEAAQILGLEVSKVTAVIEQLESDALIKRETITYAISQPEVPVTIREETAVYLTPFYYSEIGVTNRIRRIVDHPTSRLTPLKSRLTPHTFAQLRLQTGIELASQQRTAIHTAITHKVTILTGGPGTGKTTTLRTLLDLLDQGGCTYALAAPTGRAAKRLTETTGRPAKTIHRLLEFQPGEGFSRDEDNPLPVDMVIIDETSMLDLILANSLLKAVAIDSHLLLVGDVDQLPSVGAGDVLRDLIASDVPAVVRLQTIFRQAADSLIIHNAHRINQGLMPVARLDGSAAQDFFLFIKQEPHEVAELLVDIVQNRVPHKFGLDSLDDIQVLSPMYNGSAGVTNLNLMLQQALNPPGQRKLERRLGGRVFRMGDKVMQTVNNYDKNVFNGDIGRITDMDLLMQTFTVNIDGMPVVYDFLEADELVHAFAISVHKAQGSEYPCVVLPVVMQHYMMLQRNLFYTAVTRARRLVILVGTRRAINVAIKNNRVAERHTALDWRLRGKT